MHILFVCTGNICRSPTAERLVAAFDVEGLRAASAGTRALVGHPMHAESARVLEGLGGDPTGFVARRLTPAIAEDANLVLAMTKEHRDTVLEVAPRQLRRTFTLSEFAQLVTRFDPGSVAELTALRPQLSQADLTDVPDPIGHSPEVFAEVGDQIGELVRPVVDFCRRVSADLRA